MTDQWVGKTLSKVQIQQLIGRGGMADVYLGRHTTLNVPRAVKVLHGHLTDDPELRRRFDEEAKAVAALRHPNIVQVYDLDLHEGQPYLVMELLQGMSLSAYLKGLHQLGHILPFETVARLLDGIAAALDYAHARGIVHRDIKPANVLLRQGATPIQPSFPLPTDAEAILTDFGIARITTSTMQTLTGTILGTPAYMSPEQVRGEPVDARSDTYALGIMLYEMLSGTLPFDPELDTTASLLYKQANVVPPPLANVSPRIQTVVDRALQKDPRERYQKAGDLAAAFRETARPGATTIVHGRPAAAPPAPTAPARKFRPLWIGLGLGALALGVLGAGLLILPGLTGTEEPPATEAAGPVATQPAAATEPAPTETSSGPLPILAIAGGAILQDSSSQIVIADAPPLEPNTAYGVWFTSTGGGAAQLVADFSDGTIRAAFVDPQGLNLISIFDQVAISLEPSPDPAPEVPGTVVYTGEIPAAIGAEARRLDELTGGDPTLASIVAGLKSQAGSHDSHWGFALTAVADDNFEGLKGHAEHSINILAGEASEDFGDWNGDTKVQNPGDGFGLIPYLKLAIALAQSELDNPAIAPDTRQALEGTIGELGALLDQAEESMRLAHRIAASDTLDEARPLADEWGAYQLTAAAEAAAASAEDVGLRLWIPIHRSP